MPLERARSRVALIFSQRCFWLFLALVLAIVALPIAAETRLGATLHNFFDVLVLVAAVAALRENTLAFVLAIAMALALMLLQFAGMRTGEIVLLQAYFAVLAFFFLVVLVYLLGHVLRRDVMTMDKLWGAAAAFVLLGLLWGVAFALLQLSAPGAFASGGASVPQVPIADLIYFSFTTLTTTGFGDILPAHPVAKSLVVLEQIAGTLYLAILIARLVDSYPVPARRRRPDRDGER